MKKCCICGRKIENVEPAVLFINENEKTKEICDECERYAMLIEDGDNKDVKEAQQYFKKFVDEIDDEEVKAFVNELFLFKVPALKFELDDISKQEFQQIPKTLEECYSINDTTEQLWEYGKNIKKLGNVFFGIIVLLGITISILNGYEGEFNFELFICSVIPWVFYAIFACVACYAIALIMRALGNIVQNTKVTANVALYNASKKDK